MYMRAKTIIEQYDDKSEQYGKIKQEIKLNLKKVMGALESGLETVPPEFRGTASDKGFTMTGEWNDEVGLPMVVIHNRAMVFLVTDAQVEQHGFGSSENEVVISTRSGKNLVVVVT